MTIAGPTSEAGGVEFLVVDDTEANLRLTSYLLTKMGHRAHTARNAGEALELATRHPFEYALIDMHMPTIDGPALAEALKEDSRTRHIRLLLFSSSITQAEVAAARASGFTGLLDKPCHPALFVASINRLLEDRGPAR